MAEKKSKHFNVLFQVKIFKEETILFEDTELNCHKKNSQEFSVSIPCAAAVWWLLIDLFSVGRKKNKRKKTQKTFLPCSKRKKNRSVHLH